MKTTIKEIPLLFQTEMVQAILADHKTQTRREIKNYPEGDHALDMGEIFKHSPEYLYEISPYGKPGDLLWVRETSRIGAWREDGRMAFDYKASPELVDTPWVRFEDDYTGERFDKLSKKLTDFLINNGFKSGEDGYFYWEPGKSPFPWKPSIHMPKAACRLWLMVEEIRVERLQDISNDDAKSEGVKFCYDDEGGGPYFLDYTHGTAYRCPTPIKSFRSLWISINGQTSWNANPWVWVVKFRVLSTTGRPSDEVIEQSWKEVTNV